VRFGSNSKYSNVKEFASWKKTQVDSNAFSEWSNVMIIKAIDEPEVSIANAEAVKVDTDSQNSESNLTPLFIGEYSSDTETLDKYRFNLYKGDSISSDTEVLDTSEWVQKSSTSG
jgi:hypothetical protein